MLSELGIKTNGGQVASIEEGRGEGEKREKGCTGATPLP